jgi:hypothetical protein
MTTVSLVPGGTLEYVFPRTALCSLLFANKRPSNHDNLVQTGYIVKWSIFVALVGIIGIYLIGGWLHAKRRLRKGLLPLRYHRVRYLTSQVTSSVDNVLCFVTDYVYTCSG